MPENTIGKIILEAGSRGQAMTGGGAPPLSGLIGGDSSSEAAGRKIQGETRSWQQKMLGGIQGQPKWWTRMFKTMGIQVGLSGILKQSQIFTGTIGSIFQIFGAFVDVILAPFVPLFIPAIRWLARKLPGVAKGAQSFVEWLKRAFTKIGDFFKDPMKYFEVWWNKTWTAIKAWGKTMFDEAKWALGDFLKALPIIGGKVPVSLQRPEPVAGSGPGPSEESDWGATAKAAADKAWKAYLATAAARAAAKVGATVARSTVPTAGLARPIGKAIDWGEEALSLPNKAANKIIATGVKSVAAVIRGGFGILDNVVGGRVPSFLKNTGRGLGAVDDMAQAAGSRWGTYAGHGAGAVDDLAQVRKPGPLGMLGDMIQSGGSKAARLVNNPVTRRVGGALTGPAGAAAFAAYDFAEGIYDIKNILESDKKWFDGFNPGGWASGFTKPFTDPGTLSSWFGGSETQMFPGRGTDLAIRSLGTAAIPLGAAVAGPYGAAAGGLFSEATAIHTQTGIGASSEGPYGRSDMFLDIIAPSIADGFRKALNNIPGI